MQQEAHSEANGTTARRKRAYQSGVDEGLAKGSTEAQEKEYQWGFEEGKKLTQEKEYQRGFEEGKKLAHASFQSTAKALSKHAISKWNSQIRPANST